MMKSLKPDSTALLLALGFLAGGCEMIYPKPRMVQWEGREMTVCCKKDNPHFDCRQEDWRAVIQNHCGGAAKAVRSQRREQVTGTAIHADQEPDYANYYGGAPPSAETNIEIRDTTAEEQCVVYECNGPIRP
jgi:hypothetical protein